VEEIRAYAKEKNLNTQINVTPSFCYEKCTKGPVVKINDTVIEKADMEKIVIVLGKALKEAVK
jgi:NADH-quinone oxidoreductase subunit G